MGVLFVLHQSEIARLGRHGYLLKIDPAKLQVREDIAGRSALKGAYLVASTWSMSRILPNRMRKSRNFYGSFLMHESLAIDMAANIQSGYLPPQAY